MRPTPEMAESHIYFGSYTIAGVSLILALALAVAAHAQLRVISTAHALNLFTARSMQEKDLMLQEMQHRIKNSISRILAMARQTAAGSDTIEEFSQSFVARLQAMANAQDLLVSSRWNEADLEEHISIELRQVFGEKLEQAKLSGPPVKLNEERAQALGLTFHELATNALKYGGMSEKSGDLSVTWRLEGEGQHRMLVLDWNENAGGDVRPPEGEGFGTKLMDANIRGRLGGTIERRYDNDGLKVNIRIPMPAQREKDRKRPAGA
ncbi:sensor histidine kinase [Roseibium salinum]|nr:sensor histidine kinase [Roseibium salinum]